MQISPMTSYRRLPGPRLTAGARPIASKLLPRFSPKRALTAGTGRRGITSTTATAAPEAPPGDAAGGSRPPAPTWEPPELTAEHTQRNVDLVGRLKGQLMLAPLTKGNNLPFRRLCAEFGATVTMSEMVYARQLIKGAGRGRESALLKRHPSEQLYGVQIATNIIDEGIKAAEMAVAQGADWVDLNCGCPIYEATRRGLGSALLRKPTKLARLVSGISAGLTVPFTVKVRTGLGESSINVDHVVTLLKDAGAAAVTIHGRTALQRYKRPSDWSLIEQVARSVAVPVIGNGDVLTAYEARRRLTDHGCLAVMVGRGALIKPWIFEETRLGCELAPTALERVGMYRRLVSNMKDHFGDDDMGKRKAFYFLPWHLGFFCRYRPLPESVFGELSLKQPLISTRWESVACPEVGETVEGLSPLERLLRCEYEGAHAAMADTLWEAKSDGEAASALEALAATELAAWEEEMKLGRDDRDRDNNDRETEG